MRRFHEIMIKETLGLEVKSSKLTRSGDQSFGGVGIPSCAGEFFFTPEKTAAMGGKPIWYSHTIDDTLDKVDMELLKIPFKVNGVSILRLCNHPILPFEFVTISEAFKRRLNDLQKEGKAVLDLTSLLNQVEALQKKAEAFNKLAEKKLSSYLKKGKDEKLEGKFRIINAKLMELSRILIPALSSKAGKYGQDPIHSKFKPIPTLQPLETLSSMDPESEECRALRTSLLRERNKLSDDLNRGNRLLEEVLRI